MLSSLAVLFIKMLYKWSSLLSLWMKSLKYDDSNKSYWAVLYSRCCLLCCTKWSSLLCLSCGWNLQRDHSNEDNSDVLSYFSLFCKMRFRNFLKFWSSPFLAVKRLKHLRYYEGVSSKLIFCLALVLRIY